MSQTLVTNSLKFKKRRPLIASNVFGMTIFVITEVMFFTALISAFLVIKKDRPGWELPASVTLPVLTTALNTVLLILSGAFLYYSVQSFQNKKVRQSQKAILLSALFGLLFVVIQSSEWMNLIEFGLNMQTSMFGALFFLIIGSHGVHALSGVIVLLYSYSLMKKGKIGKNGLLTLQIFWYFIVGVWPILYYLVYFN